MLYARRLSTAVGLIFVLPLVMFASFRGPSGPDTETYIRQFRAISDHFETFGSFVYEPFNYVLMYIASIFVGEKYFLYFVFHSLILSFIFFIICRRYRQYRVFLLTVGVVFLLDGLTNTLRVSLAYFIFLYALSSKKKYLFFLLAFLSHVTSLIMNAVLLVVSIKGVGSKKLFAYILGGALCVLFISLYLDSILTIFSIVVGKFEIYQEVMAPSVFSGLSELFVIFSLLTIASIYNRKRPDLVVIDLMGICLLVGILYFSIGFSLAILRVLKLIVVVLTVSPFLVRPKRKIPSLLLLPIGVLYTLNFFRIVIFSDGYLPYGG